MIFVASVYPIEVDNCAGKSANEDMFLLRDCIRNKKWWRDCNLEHMHNLMLYYTNWYTEPCYCYLMTDNYFYKTKLANSNHPNVQGAKIGSFASILGIKRLPHNYEDYINNRDKYPHELLLNDKKVFSCDDIEKVFKKFEQNNFRTNPCCCVHLE